MEYYGTGKAAFNGVLSAYLSSQERILKGEKGFCRAMMKESKL